MHASRNVKRRVLVAGTPDAIATVRVVLGATFNLVCAGSSEEALRAINAPIDLIVCNVRFDESRMFDFLNAVRKRRDLRSVPIVCFRALDHPLTSAVRESIDTALQTFERATFVDLDAVAKRSGISSALLTLREVVLSSLAAGHSRGDGRKHAGPDDVRIAGKLEHPGKRS